MKRTISGRAAKAAVALSCLFVAVSCSNDYLSELPDISDPVTRAENAESRDPFKDLKITIQYFGTGTYIPADASSFASITLSYINNEGKEVFIETYPEFDPGLSYTLFPSIGEHDFYITLGNIIWSRTPNYSGWYRSASLWADYVKDGQAYAGMIGITQDYFR